MRPFNPHNLAQLFKIWAKRNWRIFFLALAGNSKLFSFSVSSDPVRLCDPVCGGVPAGPAPGPHQQHLRDPPGRVQVHDADAAAAGAAGQEYRDLVRDPPGNDLPLGSVQCECMSKVVCSI